MVTVFALAGRRIDAAGADPRFPLANVAQVRRALHELLQARRPAALVCAAACGADLIALGVAAELNIPGWIVLPFVKDRFRSSSVTDRPGDWGPCFDRLVQEAERAGRLITHAMAPDDDRTYVQANEAILDTAVERAQGGEVVALVVWEGKPRPGVDVTHAFAESARMRGIPVLEIASS